ncbi:TPA: hypothetical protein HA318_01125 [Candidatus Micrarchaeota archaeon]|nr:hypothetical protein [Candidatus Micrarchaeota archaeon]
MHEVYLHYNALQKAEKHFLKQAESRLEAMGLLSGQILSWKGQAYTVVNDYLTSENNATSVSVRFTRQAFSELAKQYHSSPRQIIIGWMHSHPGYGCFLSSTDLATQAKYFTEPFHVALVADPLKKEKGRMLLRAFKTTGPDSYRETSYAVIQKK